MKRCVIVGTGHRGLQAFVIPLKEELSDCVQLCAACDINAKRAALAGKMTNSDVPVYTDFDKMLAEIKPDIVIVTTRDALHDKFIIKALEAGCDVVSEKPMTTDEVKCNAIMAAEKKSGKKVLVTFNLRFLPMAVRIKEIIKEGILGEIYSVHLEWMLDTEHGADYFRRWHRQRANSGSLLIHKSTHHFDLLNWFIDQEPVKVNAFGTRRFYGPTREERGERCLTCKYKDKCEFYFDMPADPFYKEVYFDTEDDGDGYIRDKCVFSEEIDIEDTVSVNIKYDGGAVACYSLTAHSPYEGYKMVINGEKGRMEITNIGESGAFLKGGKSGIKFYNRHNEEITYKFSPASLSMKSGHGGADPLMRKMIFRGADSDPLTQVADTRAGAMSIGIGIAANKSMAEDRAVYLSELFDFLK